MTATVRDEAGAGVGSETGSRLRRRHRQGEALADMSAALRPVELALVGLAESRARSLRMAAEDDARGLVAGARADSERILGQAREDARRLAEQVAAARLARARRDAHERVLAARSAAYAKVRLDAVEVLRQRAGTPEGRQLVDRLVAILQVRIGGSARVRFGPEPLEVSLESGNRRAAVGPVMLVDEVLAASAAEVEVLWS